MLGVFGALILLMCTQSIADNTNQVVRMAKLQIDPAQLGKYTAALKEEIETSVRLEAGVLGLYAVSDKADATHISILEIYADDAAYKAHLETPHFMKYKMETKAMVQSLELVETVPLVLAAKSK
jgi:quinol monooxygenase YgiN